MKKNLRKISRPSGHTKAQTEEKSAEYSRGQQDAVGDSRLRPDAAAWQTAKNTRVAFDSGLFAPLCENLTSSILVFPNLTFTFCVN